jgi:hypothetical protein
MPSDKLLWQLLICPHQINQQKKIIQKHPYVIPEMKSPLGS